MIDVDTPPQTLSHQHVSHLLTSKRDKALNVLLQQFVPPSLLLSSNGDILYSFGDIGQYLSINPGETSLNLRSFVNAPAKAIVSQLLTQADQLRGEVTNKYVEGFNGCPMAEISVRPLDNSQFNADYFLFTLPPHADDIKKQQHDSPHWMDNEEAASVQHSNIAHDIRKLEEELQYTKDNLLVTAQALESSNEELQSVTNQLEIAYDQLQIANAKLQSINEEFLTVTSDHYAQVAEREQLESDEYNIIKALDTAVLFLDKQLKVRKFSDKAAEIFSLVPGDFSRSFNAISGKLASEINLDARHVLEHGGVIEKEIHTDNGSIYHMHIHRLERLFEQTNNESDQIQGVILSFNNTATNDLSSQQILITEKRFQRLVDAISDGYFEWKTDTNHFYISDTLKYTLGYPLSSTIAISELVPEDYENDLNRILQLSPENKLEVPLPILHSDGNTTWMLCRCHAVDKQGIKFIEGQFINMQHFKDLELELQSQMEQLKHSNDMLEEFAYIVTHDLKAPLRHSLHSLEYLREAQQDNDLDEQHIQTNNIDRHLRSLQSLIDDVIHFSKFTTQPRIPTLVDLNKISSELIPILKSNLNDKPLNIEVQALPILNVDSTMMRHLFQNILHNACKYNDKAHVDITIRYEVCDTQAHIIVEDNGIGFDNRFAEDMFKPFKRLVTKAEYEGSGVGLAICKTILEQHGGSISASGKLGKGSQFTLKFPISVIHMEKINA